MGKAEIITEIKNAEEKVRAMALEAEERRKQLQAEGKRLALEIIDSSEDSTRAEEETRLAKAKAVVDIRRKAIIGEGTRKADALASGARANMRTAKEFVLSEFERATDA